VKTHTSTGTRRNATCADVSDRLLSRGPHEGLTAVSEEREEPGERDRSDLDAERGQVTFETWQLLSDEVLQHALVRTRACESRWDERSKRSQRGERRPSLLRTQKRWRVVVGRHQSLDDARKDPEASGREGDGESEVDGRRSTRGGRLNRRSRFFLSFVGEEQRSGKHLVR
jgi:hypothetical protein